MTDLRIVSAIDFPAAGAQLKWMRLATLLLPLIIEMKTAAAAAAAFGLNWVESGREEGVKIFLIGSFKK